MSLWPLILALRGVEDRPDWHPERDQFNHTVQVTLNARRESDDRRLWAAAALHDVGKAIVIPARGNGHGHERTSAELIAGLVDDEIVWLVENHLRVAAFLDGEMRQRSKVRELAAHALFGLLCHLRRCDVAGRRPGYVLTATRRAQFIETCRAAGIEAEAW